MATPQTSALLVPSRHLSSLVHLAVIRDTRQQLLNNIERLNFYPASPFATVSWIIEGELYLLDQLNLASVSPSSIPLPRLIFTGPITKACVSWSPQSVRVFSISLYPEECARLLGIKMHDYVNQITALSSLPPSPLRHALQTINLSDTSASPMEVLNKAISPLLKKEALSTKDDSKTIANWLTKLQSVRTQTSARQQQRQYKLLLGQSYRTLLLYARLEQAYTLSEREACQTYADLALQAGYSDQAHMGREVKKISGFSPAKLYRYIQLHEAFWMYRLLQKHLGQR